MKKKEKQSSLLQEKQESDRDGAEFIQNSEGSVTAWAHAGPWTREQATGCERSMPGALVTMVD